MSEFLRFLRHQFAYVEDMASNQSEAYQEILKQMTPLFAKIPDTDIYEIVSEIKPQEE